MFGKIGTGELILILIIALIVVGPSKLPELGKAFGKTLNEFKKFSKEMKSDFSIEDTPKKSDSVQKVEKTENVETVEESVAIDKAE